MPNYKIQITGVTPLILHNDNIEFADELRTWREDPANKALSRPGDDRTPAFTWLGCLYLDNNELVIPQENLSRAFMEAGAAVMVPGGKNGKTFKAQVMSGITFPAPTTPLLVNGKPIKYSSLKHLQVEHDFQVHKADTQLLGLDLFVKRAKIGTAKHVRVRPRFHTWELVVDVGVHDGQLSKAVLQQIATIAGDYKGLGDWRPSSPSKPGPYGRFTAVVK